MEPVTRFSVETHSGPYEDWPRRTALLDDGRATGRTVPGYVIEGQYRCDDGYLLIMSEDCPFDESYTFLLLGNDLSQRARVTMGVPPKLLHTHWPVSDRSVRLHFYTRIVYTLTIRRGSSWWQPDYALRLTNDGAAADDAIAQRSMAELERDLEVIRERLERETVAER
jgi:hypothetical protein